MRNKSCFKNFLIRFAVPILAVVLFNGGARALELNNSSQENRLVIDIFPDEGEKPKKYRSYFDNIDAIAAEGVSILGLEKLNISGSGQFSQKTLEYIFTQDKNKDIYIIDLRAESHGFVDGMPVSWYGFRNLSNMGKSPKQVEKKQAELLKSLKNNQDVAASYSKVELESDIEERDSTEILKARDIVSEEDLVTSYGAKYKRFYVIDHHKPDDKVISEFVKFYEKLPANSRLHFHCRGGKGRTTIFMLMVDMLENAKNVGFDDIMQRSDIIGGSNLSSINNYPVHKSWKQGIAKKRLQFLQSFYQFARAR